MILCLTIVNNLLIFLLCFYLQIDKDSSVFVAACDAMSTLSDVVLQALNPYLKNLLVPVSINKY